MVLLKVTYKSENAQSKCHDSVSGSHVWAPQPDAESLAHQMTNRPKQEAEKKDCKLDLSFVLKATKFVSAADRLLSAGWR